jgi:hypothetical protein
LKVVEIYESWGFYWKIYKSRIPKILWKVVEILGFFGNIENKNYKK